MSQIKKQWKEVLGCQNIVGQLHTANAVESERLASLNKKDKAVTADVLAENKNTIVKLKKENETLKKISDHFSSKVDEWSELRESEEIDFAMTEDGTPKTALLRHEKTGSLMFTPEGEKKARAAVRKLKEESIFIDQLELPIAEKLDYEFLQGFVIFKKK
jgi:hypothetical protein